MVCVVYRAFHFRRIVQQLRRLAIVESQELLQHQSSEQLRLRELLRAELMAILGRRADADRVREFQHPPRTLRRTAHTRATHERTLAADESHGFSTEHSWHLISLCLRYRSARAQQPEALRANWSKLLGHADGEGTYNLLKLANGCP